MLSKMKIISLIIAAVLLVMNAMTAFLGYSSLAGNSAEDVVYQEDSNIEGVPDKSEPEEESEVGDDTEHDKGAVFELPEIDV